MIPFTENKYKYDIIDYSIIKWIRGEISLALALD